MNAQDPTIVQMARAARQEQIKNAAESDNRRALQMIKEFDRKLESWGIPTRARPVTDGSLLSLPVDVRVGPLAFRLEKSGIRIGIFIRIYGTCPECGKEALSPMVFSLADIGELVDEFRADPNIHEHPEPSKIRSWRDGGTTPDALYALELAVRDLIAAIDNH